jgi:hypothetical protein
MEEQVPRPGACQGSIQKPQGLSHTVNMPDGEHCRFVKAFQIYKDQTDFENEFSPIMLKYYVQMAFLEGWKKSKEE